jgi:sn-glycerol 3-phosphate transport system substrate-binding protein
MITLKRILIVIMLFAMLSACGPAATPEPAPVEPAPVEAAPTDAPAAPVVEAAPTQEPVMEEPEMDPVTIQVYYPVAVDAPITAILNGYIADFQAKYPYITVEPVYSGGYADVQTAIQTTIEGGGTPPVLAVLLATSLYDLINADYISPMDAYVANMENGKAYLDDFLPAFMDNSYYDGQLWSVPFQRSAVVLYYNVEKFADAGLQPPTSWASWAEAAKALTSTEGTSTNWGLKFSSDWPYWLFQPLAIGSGQNIFIDDCTMAFNDPKVVEAVQFYIDLSKVHGAMPAGVQASWATDTADFSSGSAAMIAHTTGSLTGILSQAGFTVGVMPYPGKEEGTFASVPGGGNFYMMKGAPDEQKDAAWKFIELLTSPELSADYSIQTGYIASRMSAYETPAMVEYAAKVPQALQARDAIMYAEGELAIQNLGQVRSIFHNYIQKAFNGEMTAQDAMDAAQAEAETALVPFCQ